MTLAIKFANFVYFSITRSNITGISFVLSRNPSPTKLGRNLASALNSEMPSLAWRLPKWTCLGQLRRYVFCKRRTANCNLRYVWLISWGCLQSAAILVWHFKTRTQHNKHWTRVLSFKMSIMRWAWLSVPKYTKKWWNSRVYFAVIAGINFEGSTKMAAIRKLWRHMQTRNYMIVFSMFQKSDTFSIHSRSSDRD